MKTYWFKRKLYGWGWYPSTWQGWLVMLVYIIGVVKIFMILDISSHSGSETLISFVFPFIVLSVILLIICYTKGDKPRWQWGKEKKINS